MKTLLVYYSKTGIVDAMAQRVAKQIKNIDLYRLQTVRTYAEDMYAAWDQAQIELKNDQMPKLKGNLPSLKTYDQIIIAGPVWGFKPSNPILSYIHQTDFANKPVAAFWTYYDHDEQYATTLHQEIPNFDPKHGLPLTMGLIHDAKKVDQAIAQWLTKLTE